MRQETFKSEQRERERERGGGGTEREPVKQTDSQANRK